MEGMQEVKVLVPEDRVPEFYEMVGKWLRGDTDGERDADETRLEPWSNADVLLAKEVWAHLTPMGRELVTILSDHPDQRISSEQLAEDLQTPNAFGVAGVLGGLGRRCYSLGREFPVIWDEGTLGESSTYWMTSDVAALFREARDSS